MVFKHLQEIIYKMDSTVQETLKGFSKTAIWTHGKGFGLVLDHNDICQGVITDGDLRTFIAEGGNLYEPVAELMNRNFIFSKPNDSRHKVLRTFDSGIKDIPILDTDGRVLDLLQLSRFDASSRIDSKIIRARVPVRVSFCGGGTDMSYYLNNKSGAALTSTINRYCYVTIIPRSDNKIKILSKDMDANYEADSIEEIKYGDNLDLIKAAIKVMKPQFGFDIEVMSEFESGTGLGGSAAVASAIIGSLNYFRGDNQLDKYLIADLAYQAERIELEIAGGWQDQYATAFGGVNLIEFRQDEIMVNPLKIPRDIILELKHNLLLFRFGNNRFSSQIILDQKENYSKDQNSIHKRYEIMTNLVYSMKEYLLRGQLKKFGSALNKGWELKKSFSSRISNSYLDTMYHSAITNGALGGKILGAGGSGYLLIYAAPPYQKQIIAEIVGLGANLEIFDFVESGLEAWATNRY